MLQKDSPLKEKLGEIPEGFKPFERKGEKIGGGFWIARRGRIGRRVKITERPFEHPTYASAQKELSRLKEMNPELDFFIMCDAKNVKSLIGAR